MKLEESRKQFEEWCKQRGYTEGYYFFRQSHPNHYDDDQIEEMWNAWQASRENNCYNNRINCTDRTFSNITNEEQRLHDR